MRHCITETDAVRYREGQPVACFNEWSSGQSNADRMLLVDFFLPAYWLPDSPQIALTAVYLQVDGAITFAVTDGSLSAVTLPVADQFAAWSEQLGFCQFHAASPIALSPVAIDKPWGRELWYTGVERRGVCQFVTAVGATPIPWLQAVVPDDALGVPGAPLVLLKILDPVAQPVIGDLYFELHEEKQEVYVVTHVDAQAWPDGTGYIRMGFAVDKMRGYADNGDAFRAAYLEAVRRYETVRRQIDGLPPGRNPDTDTLSREEALREQMDSFTQLQPLRVGDVVKVPLLTPHSLQHGVRTIEFQTPVYERKILSFAQRVLTQDHWDTAEAVGQMRLQPQPVQEFETLVERERVLVERIVDFSDFEVRRVRLSPGGALEIGPLPRYGLVMVVEGCLGLHGAGFAEEQAAILPLGWAGELAPLEPACSVVFLLAFPRH